MAFLPTHTELEHWTNSLHWMSSLTYNDRHQTRSLFLKRKTLKRQIWFRGKMLKINIRQTIILPFWSIHLCLCKLQRIWLNWWRLGFWRWWRLWWWCWWWWCCCCCCWCWWWWWCWWWCWWQWKLMRHFKVQCNSRLSAPDPSNRLLMISPRNIFKI